MANNKINELLQKAENHRDYNIRRKNTMNKKIWIATVNADSVEVEHEWSSLEELQKDWCSEECPCPCGDDEVLGYAIDGLVQDTYNIKENKYGYRDFSSLLKVLGVKDND